MSESCSKYAGVKRVLYFVKYDTQTRVMEARADPFHVSQVGTMVGEHKKSMEMMSSYISGTY